MLCICKVAFILGQEMSQLFSSPLISSRYGLQGIQQGIRKSSCIVLVICVDHMSSTIREHDDGQDRAMFAGIPALAFANMISQQKIGKRRQPWKEREGTLRETTIGCQKLDYIHGMEFGVYFLKERQAICSRDISNCISFYIWLMYLLYIIPYR